MNNEEFIEPWDGYDSEYDISRLAQPQPGEHILAWCSTNADVIIPYSAPIWYCKYCQRQTDDPLDECEGCGAVEFTTKEMTNG